MKVFRIPEDLKERLREEFETALDKNVICGDSFKFEKKLVLDDKKSLPRAKLLIRETAMSKMRALVQKCAKEIAWHGLARRSGDGCEYEIYDIICYPQEVTSATVKTDDTKYGEWISGLSDEQINNLRMQGHSHVSMGVTPSTTDEQFYKELLTQVNRERFYIFLILNKQGDMFVRIADSKFNLQFDKEDIDVVIENDDGLSEFVKEAMGMLEESKPVYASESYRYYPQSSYSTPQKAKAKETPKNVGCTDFDSEVDQRRILSRIPNFSIVPGLGYVRYEYERQYGMYTIFIDGEEYGYKDQPLDVVYTLANLGVTSAMREVREIEGYDDSYFEKCSQDYDPLTEDYISFLEEMDIAGFEEEQVKKPKKNKKKGVCD